MASAQFLKDFRRAYQVKKSSEHREKVLQRQQIAAVGKESLAFVEIVSDNSPGKKSSHCRLKVFAQKHGPMGLVKIYKKDQLSKLSNAYGVSMRSTLNQRQMADRLLEAIKSCPNERIPFPFSLASNLESTTETNSGSLILRIRRV